MAAVVVAVADVEAYTEIAAGRRDSWEEVDVDRYHPSLEAPAERRVPAVLVHSG